MNLNFQYQQSDNDQLNVFTTLGGTPRHPQLQHFEPISTFSAAATSSRLSTNYNHSSSGSINNFSGVNNVSNAIGIQGVSDSSFAWGLPRLSFSSITGLSDVNPSRSIGDRVGTNVTWRRPFGRHQIQSGGVFNYDKTTTNNESNANGAFVFTGIYTANGGALGGLTGFDFADFLLGMPQQASIAYGPGETTLTGRDLGFFFQDEWRRPRQPDVQPGRALGSQISLRRGERPSRQPRRHVGFHGRSAGASGEEGTFTGSFPRALIEKDTNNVSPRLAAAWRGPGQFQFRGSWEIQYNDNTYSGIARRLAQQPPFATTGTNIGGLSRALLMENALTGININETRNNYGIDRDYVVGTANRRWSACSVSCSARTRSPHSTGTRSARTSRSCARRTAMPTGCASKASSRSPGRRPRAVRSSIRRPSSSARTSRADWDTRSRIHLRQVARQLSVHRRWRWRQRATSRRTIRTSTPSGPGPASSSATASR